ncbi:MAG TPA: hypothetical protein VHN19_01805 [Burkholderiales bacterium]|jgi:hypothetical protein|nr:hypothetical protein [Burkholderiales bacterium]
MNRLHYTLVAAATALAFPAFAAGGLAGGLGGTVNNVLSGTGPASASAAATLGSTSVSVNAEQGKLSAGDADQAKAPRLHELGQRDIRSELPGLKVHDDAFESQIRRLSLKEKDFNRVAERGKHEAKQRAKPEELAMQDEQPAQQAPRTKALGLQKVKSHVKKADAAKRRGMDRVKAKDTGLDETS